MPSAIWAYNNSTAVMPNAKLQSDYFFPYALEQNENGMEIELWWKNHQ